MNVFVPKEHPDLPDCYGIEITFHDGKLFKIDIASHKMYPDTKTLEISTFEDTWSIFPLFGIKEIKFDKRLSKIIAIKNELVKPKP